MQDGRALWLCIIFGIFASYLTLSQSKVNSTCWELPLADDEWIPKYFWRHYVPRETSFIISGVVSSLDEHGQICIRRQWLTAPGTLQAKRQPHKAISGYIGCVRAPATNNTTNTCYSILEDADRPSNHKSSTESHGYWFNTLFDHQRP